MKDVEKNILLPSLNTNHLFRMTDSTGILQHAKCSVPNYNEGYTTDDNARALIVALKLYETTSDNRYLELIYRYSAFIFSSLTDDGWFRNIMNYSRVFIDEKGTEDCFGRTLTALSYLYSCQCVESGLKEFAYLVLRRVMRNVLNLSSPISMAYSIIGLSILHDMKEFSNEATRYLLILSEKIINSYNKYADENWQWFLNKISYANGILPFALFKSFVVTENERYLKVATESLDFLVSNTFEDSILRVIGNNGWYERGKERAYFDEQPIDACDMVLACSEAYKITEKDFYKQKAIDAFNWFLGKNILSEPLYNQVTGGCKDGIGEDEINQNEGAESLLSFLIARTAIEDLIKSGIKDREMM